MSTDIVGKVEIIKSNCEMDSVSKDGGICENPNERFYSFITSWDFVPEVSTNKSSTSNDQSFKQIPNAFPSFSNYVDIWEPLLFHEIKSNVLNSFPLKDKIESKISSFSWREDCDNKKYNLAVLQAQFGLHASEMDLVLMSLNPISGADFNVTSSQPICGPYLLGFVFGQHYANGLRVSTVKICRSSWDSFKNKMNIAVVDKKEKIGGSSADKDCILYSFQMHFIVVENMRSSWREFHAMHELRNAPLINHVLGGFDTEQKMVDEITGVSDNFLSHLRNKYNPSQLKAIFTAVTPRKGFTLIQGPPGTGKTSTIIGILNSIYIREYNRYYELALSTVLGNKGMACRASNCQNAWLDMVTELMSHKPRILVVAPSNIAVDNIIERIMSDRFRDDNCDSFQPQMLRVGSGMSPSVHCVSLRQIVIEEELELDQDVNIILGEMDYRILQVIEEVYLQQTMMFNLKLAFDAYPLSEGIDLCVCERTAKPVWVYHKTCTLSYAPPITAAAESSPEAISSAKVSFEKLPQYKTIARRLTKLLDKLGNAKLKRSWFKAVIAGSTNSRSKKVNDNRHLLESSIIDKAKLLFTTLNGSGHPSMENTEFCVTVIDEAAQCVEPSVLIALRRGCEQCIMVGDQKQLPATTFSLSANAVGFGRSLFERLLDLGHPRIVLDIQYRMVPGISAFPSSEYYGGALINGDNVCAADYSPHYIEDNAPIKSSPGSSTIPRSSLTLFSSFMFFDLQTSSESYNSVSKVNLDEVQLCVSIIEMLAEEAKPSDKVRLSVGVITFYGDQMVELENALKISGLMSESFVNIECKTVDGFQGREKDFIIISSVRANEKGNLGFVLDPRRLNVALTRGKFGTFVVGHARTLSSNKGWEALILHAKEVNGFVRVEGHGNIRQQILKRRK